MKPLVGGGEVPKLTNVAGTADFCCKIAVLVASALSPAICSTHEALVEHLVLAVQVIVSLVHPSLRVTRLFVLLKLESAIRGSPFSSTQFPVMSEADSSLPLLPPVHPHIWTPQNLTPK